LIRPTAEFACEALAVARIVFQYEFEQNQHNSISYEYSLEEDEKFDLSMLDGAPFLHLSRSGMLMLARILIKLAHGDCDDGFHVHLNKDFNEGLPERLVIGLSLDDSQGKK
jgi:hypothetical protein